MANKLNQWRAQKQYSAKLNLLAHIHAEVEPILTESRKADSLLDNCTKGRPASGVNETETGSLDKYSKVYTLRPCSQLGDLAGENDSLCGASYMQGADKAETTTRNVSANN